jgi:LmbE family N-acetylglucosaminyl deacetylase
MMRIDQQRSQWRQLPLGSVDDIVGSGCALIIAPHPDDEALGCGGLIAACCNAGRPPVVVYLTDGAMSHPASKAFPRECLIRVREQEAKAAGAILGLVSERLVFFREPDTKAPCEGNAATRLADRITGLAELFGCTCILAPWRFDPHCDHVAAAAIAEKAAAQGQLRHMAYPVWGWLLPADQTVADLPSTGWRLDITPHRALKLQAIAAHQSQYGDLITDDPSGFRLPPELLTVFKGKFETFLRP